MRRSWTPENTTRMDQDGPHNGGRSVSPENILYLLHSRVLKVNWWTAFTSNVNSVLCRVWEERGTCCLSPPGAPLKVLRSHPFCTPHSVSGPEARLGLAVSSSRRFAFILLGWELPAHGADLRLLLEKPRHCLSVAVLFLQAHCEKVWHVPVSGRFGVWVFSSSVL